MKKMFCFLSEKKKKKKEKENAILTRSIIEDTTQTTVIQLRYETASS